MREELREKMYYYHMTPLENLRSICDKGLIPQSGVNSKLIGDKQVKVFFSEGFEGAIALFVDFDIVYDKIKKGQMNVTDESTMKMIMSSQSLYDYLGEGVYLRFDGTNIKNERNFENGCTDMSISPTELEVCILRGKNDNSIIFSRFEIIKYMMSEVNVEKIRYYGANYDGSPDFEEATKRIQQKVKEYYDKHQMEILKYSDQEYVLDLMNIDDFIKDNNI